MRLCARSEKSSGDALRLMQQWQVPQAERQGVLERLVKDRFIDDGRYAEAYVREKMRFSGWGVHKIRAALRAKSVAPDIIAKALDQLTPEGNTERLAEMIRKKAAKTSYKNAYDLKTKLVRFGMSRGFDLDDVLSAIEEYLCESEL